MSDYEEVSFTGNAQELGERILAELAHGAKSVEVVNDDFGNITIIIWDFEHCKKEAGHS